MGQLIWGNNHGRRNCGPEALLVAEMLMVGLDDLMVLMV